MRKTIPTNLYYNFLVATLFVLGTVSTGFSQCPTVTNAAQSFCDVEAPMVSSLKATNTGGGIAWYATRNSTTPLSNTTGLIHDTVYFAGSPTCSFADRQEVSVTIYGPPAALGFQGPCVDTPNEATISSLFATGNDIQWYNVPFGGTPLAATTILKDNTIYYVDQSNPITGCRSSRRSVLVSVGVVPVPTGEAIQEFCADSEPTVANLVASGNNRWYSTKSSGTALDINTPLVDGESYFATTFTEICESYDRLEVVVDFIAPNDSGLAGTIDLCLTDLSSTGTVNLFDALGGTPATNGKWRGPFTTSNGNQGTVSVTTMTVEGSPYVFSYDVTSDSCPTSTTNVSVTIVLPPDPGTNGTLMVCSNDSPIDLFGSLGGTPDTGGTWSPALTSGSGIFDPSTDAAGIYTYTVAGTAPCAEASATVEVQISPEPNPGTNGAVILCVDSSSENLFTYLGGSPETGGTWSPMLASGTGVFDPAKDAAGTYTYTVSGIDPCGDASASVTVTVNPLPDAGTSANLLLCVNDTPQDLFNSLGGTPDAGGTWSPALNSGSGIFDPAIDSAGIYTYTVQGTAPCGETSATVSVTINPEAEPGTNGTLIVCIDGTPENLFDSLGGTSQTGGTWSPALASGTGIFDPAKDAAGIYTYTVSGMDPCGDASASVTVTVNPLPDAGANGNLVLCSNDAPQDLFNSLGGTPETGGTWSPALASG
ncbi:hypothetical protein MWU76_15470, partial [Gelidibacter sp. F2691]|nr:hypothetical protein [Gelidibacter sp. F2691]